MCRRQRYWYIDPLYRSSIYIIYIYIYHNWLIDINCDCCLVSCFQPACFRMNPLVMLHEIKTFPWVFSIWIWSRVEVGRMVQAEVVWLCDSLNFAYFTILSWANTSYPVIQIKIAISSYSVYYWQQTQSKATHIIRGDAVSQITLSLSIYIYNIHVDINSTNLHTSIHAPIRQSVHPSIPAYIHTSRHAHIDTSIHPHNPHIPISTYPHIHISTEPDIHTSTHPSIRPSLHPSVHPYIDTYIDR